MKIVKKLGLIVLLGLAYCPDLTSALRAQSHQPPSGKEPIWDVQTRAIAKKACFDCHSNEML
jgi:hypothetical protein